MHWSLNDQLMAFGFFLPDPTGLMSKTHLKKTNWSGVGCFWRDKKPLPGDRDNHTERSGEFPVISQESSIIGKSGANNSGSVWDLSGTMPNLKNK